MAIKKPFTTTDLKNASNVGKRYCSFQFIEGQLPRNSMEADGVFAISYLEAIIANVMAGAKLECSPEELAESIKVKILDYYKTLKKGSEEEPKKES